jgi:thiol-disulfide isomerase/thioredoxin
MIMFLIVTLAVRKTLANVYSRLQWIALMFLNHGSPKTPFRGMLSPYSTAALLAIGILSLTSIGCSDAPQAVIAEQSVPEESNVAKEQVVITKQSARVHRKLQVATAVLEEEPKSIASPERTAASQSAQAASDTATPTTALQIGDKAPELAVKKWVQEVPSQISEDRVKSPVRVISFWATWCEPSTAALMRLQSLQKRFDGQVVCSAVSSESPETVTGFLNSVHGESQKFWRDVLSIGIAADHRGTAEEKFLLAGSEQGLPTSIVVDQNGLVAWSGSPDRLEPVLAKILAGEWDLKQARETHQLTYERTVAQRNVRDQLALAKASNDPESCLQLIDGLLLKFPDDDEFELLRLQFLLRSDRVSDANTLASSLLTDLIDDTQRLNQLAWMLCEAGFRPELNLELARSAAERAVQLTKEEDVSSLETFARVCFRSGELDAAVAAQSKAIKLAPGDSNLQEALNLFRQASLGSVEKAGFKESSPGKG